MLLLALLLLPSALQAQEREAPLELPRAVAEQAVGFFNAPTTIRFNGRTGVPQGRSVVGDVATLGGPFTVGGRIDGDLLVLNGDLVFVEGGSVTGDVTVIGGMVSAREPGDISGTLSAYPAVLRVVDRDGQIELSARQLRSFDRAEGLGRTTFTVRAGTNYNRVEGLPVMFGPLFETAEPNSLKVEALGIWRTETGLTWEGGKEFGYQLLVEQRFGSDRLFSIGGTLHSTVAPISPLGLSDLESSLSTFFLRKDYRDYYERIGWSAFATAALPRLPLSLRVEYLDEEHRFAPVKAPWTLRRNDTAWRPQPLVAEGDIYALSGELAYDSRNDFRDPTDGWWLRARVTHGLDGTLAIPEFATLSGEGEVVAAQPVDATFTGGLLDLRRYARVGPESDVALRVVMAGSVDGDALPPQFQHALGGLPTLPGYGLFSQDCGARLQLVEVQRVEDDRPLTQRAFTRYGCDRVALLQLEYRRRLDLDLDFGPWQDDRWEWYPQVDLSPALGFFFGVGRGWSKVENGFDTDMVSDAGFAFFFGNLGLYAAYPFRGADREVNFFLRFQRRF
jgi:hypothetical protein